MGEGKGRHRQMIGRCFAIASKEATVEQFLRFRKDHQVVERFAPTHECAVNNVTWYDAVAYCNWLSEQESIPRDQWCYEPNKDGEYAEGMKIAPNYLQRTGYRLPTEEEWEYACRAGAETGFSFGEQDDLLGRYAWTSLKTDRLQPVGTLRPNDFGLFDMHGNAWEWTQSVDKRSGWNLGFVGELAEKDYDARVLCGGSYTLPTFVRSAVRFRYVPRSRYPDVGFRPARTIIP